MRTKHAVPAALFFILFSALASKSYSDTYYPDWYSFYYSASQTELSLTPSTQSSTDGSFTLELTGSYLTDWPWEDYSCTGLSCYENIYGLEFSEDAGVTWEILPGSYLYSFWGADWTAEFNDVAPGTYLYRAVNLYWEEYVSSLWDEAWYSPTVVQVVVSGGSSGGSSGGTIAGLSPDTLFSPSGSAFPAVQLSWEHNSTDVATYQLEVSMDSGPFESLADVSGTLDSTSVNGLASANYVFRIRGCNADYQCDVWVSSEAYTLDIGNLEDWGDFPIVQGFSGQILADGTHEISWNLSGFVDYDSDGIEDAGDWPFTDWSDWWASNWYTEIRLEMSENGGTTWAVMYDSFTPSDAVTTRWYNEYPQAGNTVYRLTWYWQDGDNGFETYSTAPITLSTTSGSSGGAGKTLPPMIYSMYHDDFNEDGFFDWLFVPESNALSDAPIKTTFLLAYNGDTGLFEFTKDYAWPSVSKWELLTNGPPIQSIIGYGVELADINADGAIDIITPHLDTSFTGEEAYRYIVFTDPNDDTDAIHVRHVDQELENFYTDLRGWANDLNYFDQAIIPYQQALRVRIVLTLKWSYATWFGWIEFKKYTRTVVDKYFSLQEIIDFFGLATNIGATRISYSEESINGYALEDFEGVFGLRGYCSYFYDLRGCLGGVEIREIENIPSNEFDTRNHSLKAKNLVELLPGSINGLSIDSTSSVDAAYGIFEDLLGVPLGEDLASLSKLPSYPRNINHILQPLPSDGNSYPETFPGRTYPQVEFPEPANDPIFDKKVGRIIVSRVFVIGCAIFCSEQGESDDWLEDRDYGIDIALEQAALYERNDPNDSVKALIGEGEAVGPFVRFPGASTQLDDAFYLAMAWPERYNFENNPWTPEQDTRVRWFNSGWVWALVAMEADVYDIGLAPGRVVRGTFYPLEREGLEGYPKRFEYEYDNNDWSYTPLP